MNTKRLGRLFAAIVPLLIAVPGWFCRGLEDFC